MKVRGTILKFGAKNSVLDIISSDCEIDIPEMVPFLFEFDYTKPPIGHAEVKRTDEGLIFTGEITDPKIIEILTNTYDGKECMGCGGHYDCVKRDGLGNVVQMRLKAVSCTYGPVNPDYKFEIVEVGEQPEDEEIWCTECPYFKYVADDMDDSWYGAKCHKDGHEANPSMYAVQSLHDDCPLKRKEGE